MNKLTHQGTIQKVFRTKSVNIAHSTFACGNGARADWEFVHVCAIYVFECMNLCHTHDILFIIIYFSWCVTMINSTEISHLCCQFVCFSARSQFALLGFVFRYRPLPLRSLIVLETNTDYTFITCFASFLYSFSSIPSIWIELFVHT